MLTTNADNESLYCDYHQPRREKGKAVILPTGAYGEWVTASADENRDFLVPFPSEKLVATPMN